MHAQQLLDYVSPKMEAEDFSDATAVYNLAKNRYTSNVAGTYHCSIIISYWITFNSRVGNHRRVFLQQTEDEGSDYINANFVDVSRVACM